jgi:aminoglycoside phosphotransferase (APT) family kinase protein
MHVDEVAVDAQLVRALLCDQFPQWADLSVTPVRSSGTDHALFRLGDELVVRLPRIGWAVGGVEHEHRWLPLVAPHLRVDVPTPVGLGQPAEEFAWPWGVFTWLGGVNPVVGALVDPAGLATQLADLVRQLRAIDLPGGVRAGHLVADRDPFVREAIEQLTGLVDTAPVIRFWDEAVRLPPWEGLPVWMHGDLAPGNVLLTGTRLTGLIDFSGLGVGDPAGDLAVAWNLLPAEVRPDFRAALAVDDATWARTSAYAVGQALVQLPYYRLTNPPLADSARHVITHVLADRGVAWVDDTAQGTPRP